MAIKALGADTWKRRFRRALISGPPNSWKTTALRTWPRPIAILSYPGELGASSIPQEDGIQAFVWEAAPATQGKPFAIMQELEQFTVAILSGKQGPIKTFAGDGLHKLYKIIYEAERLALANSAIASKMDEETIKSRAYGYAHTSFLKYVHMVTESTVDYVVFTSWSERERDGPENPQNKSTHVYPALPGQMATLITGEFGVVLHSQPGQEVGPGRFSAGTWQVRPHGRVWGASLKLPPEIAGKVPTFVPQDWQKLEGLVLSLAAKPETQETKSK